MSKTLILGMGNTLLRDDAVGIVVAQRLAETVDDDNVDIRPFHVAGFRLVEALEGYHKAIIVDAIHTGEKEPGEVYWIDLKDLRNSRADRSLHDIHIADALDLGRKYDMEMPSEIKILAVEVEDVETWSEHLSEDGRTGVSRAIELITRELSHDNSD